MADFLVVTAIVVFVIAMLGSGLFTPSVPGGCPQVVVPLFSVCCENGEMGMGEHREGDVPVPGAVEADLVMIEGDF